MNTIKFPRLAGLVAVLMLAGLLAACGESTRPASPPTAAGGSSGVAPAPASKIKVVATTTQIGDLVKNVGGNRIELTTLLKPGMDAHEFEPGAGDSKALAAAQLVFKNGLNLDDWLDKTVQNSGTRAAVVVVSQGVKIRPATGNLAVEFKEGDPHIWFSTANARKMVDNIAASLSGQDPAGAAAYQSTATAYKAQIEQMARQVKEELEAIPPANRKLVTNHEAFGYFLEEFGLTFVGSIIPSLDSTAEPSAREIQELLNKIKTEKVKAIFTEETINPKLAEQISREAGVKIYSNLYGDSLGEAGSEGDTYLKMMLSNARNIAAGLK